MEAGSEAVERSYVGLGRRLLAMLIDNGMWFFGAALLLGSGLEALYEESPDAGVVATFVLASLWFNYFAFCEWRWGQTVGKNAVGIEVVSWTGRRSAAPNREVVSPSRRRACATCFAWSTSSWSAGS